ncbi:MAG: carbohydrate kinase [Gammaproteobacteria bacterium]|nr:MAG: carbohydrate kinase [Gammaproteobacteria bacterium]
MAVCIGIDLGTSGCRGVALDAGATIIASARAALPVPQRSDTGISQDPGLWWQAVNSVLTDLASQLRGESVRRMAVNGTSATLVACDGEGNPLLPALMYNDQRPLKYAHHIARFAPRDSGGHGVSSSLAKYLWYADKLDGRDFHVLHQSDWITGRLSGSRGVSDYNNCLKLGYDAQQLRWPQWMERAGIERERFPQVVAPGASVGTLRSDLAAGWGLPDGIQLVAGTTDSVAACIAAGVDRAGSGVTSLGSTLVIKLLAERPLFAPEYGVYSHRLGDFWLVGGASNSGGAVLKQFFSQQQLDHMTPQLQPHRDTGLNYYPLPGKGERFPLNDPCRLPRMQPPATSPVQQFQGILEGIARIEATGYSKLLELGAPLLDTVYTAGRGADNDAWTRIRQRYLGDSVVMRPARFTEAACGTALLAWRRKPLP